MKRLKRNNVVKLSVKEFEALTLQYISSNWTLNFSSCNLLLFLERNHKIKNGRINKVKRLKNERIVEAISPLVLNYKFNVLSIAEIVISK